MITVTISVGGDPVYCRSAIKVEGGTKPDDICKYIVDDGRVIRHRYGDGAPKLAQKILQGILPIGTGKNEDLMRLVRAVEQDRKDLDKLYKEAGL